MWKRDDSTRSDLQDAVNRTRGELRRSAPDGSEPPSLTELQPPEIDHAAIRVNVATKPDPAPTPGAARIGLHPFIQGLLEIMPEPGAEWPREKREQWLETARQIFALLYGEPSGQRPPPRFIDAPTTHAPARVNPDPAVPGRIDSLPSR